MCRVPRAPVTHGQPQQKQTEQIAILGGLGGACAERTSQAPTHAPSLHKHLVNRRRWNPIRLPLHGSVFATLTFSPTFAVNQAHVILQDGYATAGLPDATSDTYGPTTPQSICSCPKPPHTYCATVLTLPSIYLKSLVGRRPIGSIQVPRCHVAAPPSRHARRHAPTAHTLPTGAFPKRHRIPTSDISYLRLVELSLLTITQVTGQMLSCNVPEGPLLSCPELHTRLRDPLLHVPAIEQNRRG